jgi:ABC-2 type transport system permease protein
MNALTLVFADSATMLRRNLIHARRYPSLTLIVAAIPVVLYLLFVYVFGATLGDGLPGSTGGREAYIAYLTPGILLTAIAGSSQGTAISVSMDMTQGIIARFRTMSIPRSAVLAGHVVGSVIQTMVGIAFVIAVAVLTGFRPTTGPIEIAGAIGMLTLATFSLTWLSVALGLWPKTVEAASNLPMPLILLPFFGSGFVPTESMPAVVRTFAEFQPFTPIIETVRGLLLGTPIGWSGAIAIGWCVAISLIGYLWAMRLYDRDPIR